MPARSLGAMIAGMVLEAVGLLFLLQGLGVVRWPASSFMIDQRIWVVIGALIVLAGTAIQFRTARGLR